MYITCPSCSTSYEVDGTQIGPSGRTVRCFNCHHSWQQYPVAAQAPFVAPRPEPRMQPPRYVPQSQQGYVQQTYAQSAYAEPAYMPQPGYGREMPRDYYGPPAGYAMPPQGPAAYARQPMPMAEPEAFPEPMPQPRMRPEPPARESVKVEPPPAPAPKPAPAAKPEPAPVMEDEDLPSDAELDKMLGPARDDAASRTFGGGAAKGDVDDALDEEKIAKLPDPEPLRDSYAGKPKDDDDDDLDDIEIEDIPDPDPIPTVYGGASDDEDDEDLEEKSSGLKLLIAPTITIVAIGAIFAGLVLAREPIVKLVPSANDYFYDLLGLHVMVPGEGLKRELTRTAMETIAEVDHVIATGLVTNISDKEQPLPQVVVQLIDANEKVLSSKTMTLEKASLQPGEVLQFKAVFDGAPATARKVRTEWGGFADPNAPQQPAQH